MTIDGISDGIQANGDGAAPIDPRPSSQASSSHTSASAKSGHSSFHRSPSSDVGDHHHHPDLPLVICQPTEWNDRLSSLLSAVFLRRLRDDFADAIREAFPRSLDALASYDIGGGGGHSRRFSEDRRKRSFSRRIVLAVVGASSSSNECGFATDLEDFVALCSSQCPVSLFRLTAARDLERLMARPFEDSSEGKDGRAAASRTSSALVVVAATNAAAEDLAYFWRRRHGADVTSDVVAATILVNPTAAHHSTNAELDQRRVPHCLVVLTDPAVLVPRASHPNTVIAALSSNVLHKVNSTTVDLWVARTILLYCWAVVNIEESSHDTKSSPSSTLSTHFSQSKL